MRPGFGNGALPVSASHGLRRYRLHAHQDAKVRNAVLDPRRTEFRACVFTSRQPQDLQRRAQIAEYEVRNRAKIDRALLNLKVQAEQCRGEHWDIRQIVGEVNLPRLKFRDWSVV